MEVMIVVVIIGILAALAYPNLEKYLKRALNGGLNKSQCNLYSPENLLYP